jgi:hypothetical protein
VQRSVERGYCLAERSVLERPGDRRLVAPRNVTIERLLCDVAASLLRRLVAGLSPRRPGFDPGSVNVGYVVEKVALGQVFPPDYFCFPLKNTNHLHHRVAQ